MMKIWAPKINSENINELDPSLRTVQTSVSVRGSGITGGPHRALAYASHTNVCLGEKIFIKPKDFHG